MSLIRVERSKVNLIYTAKTAFVFYIVPVLL